MDGLAGSTVEEHFHIFGTDQQSIRIFLQLTDSFRHRGSAAAQDPHGRQKFHLFRSGGIGGGQTPLFLRIVHRRFRIALDRHNGVRLVSLHCRIPGEQNIAGQRRQRAAECKGLILYSNIFFGM